MSQKITVIGMITAVVIGLAVLLFVFVEGKSPTPVDPTPKAMTLSGTYGCLPHKDRSGPTTMECGFGIQADSGEWYAVNFGQSADAMSQFQSGAHITAEGFVVPVEALSTDQWSKYDIRGIFTVTKTLSPTSPVTNTKINIVEVCQGALAYTTFPDGASAEKFVTECIDGKHPEVVERYKNDMGWNGAAI